MSDDEVRTESSTGGLKGTKLARYDLIPAGPLRELARHYGRGARKYEDHQWRKGYEWSKSFAAMQRHAWWFWQGEDIDPDTGSPHLAAVAWHAFALLQWASEPELARLFDDRPGVADRHENCDDVLHKQAAHATFWQDAYDREA